MTRSKILAAAASTLLVAAVYVLRLDRAAGLAVDDAYYIMLGQSLAQGTGFALVSSAAAPILPSVPPVFPALLALVFRVFSSFPDNVVLLKSISVAAMLAAGGLAFVYARRTRGLPDGIAWCVAMAVALTPGLVFLATSTVMAECVFTALQLAGVVAVERAVSARDGSGARDGALAGALTAATWLVRSAGIALVAAALLRLVRGRRWSAVAGFVAVFALAAVPWTIYTRTHQPSQQDRERHGGSIAVAYGDAVLLRIAGTAASGRVEWRELPLRAARNVLNLAGRDPAGLLTPVVDRGATESGEEVFSLGALGFLSGSMGNAPATIVWSLLLAVVVLAGYVHFARRAMTVTEWLLPITAAMLIVYPYWTFRFVLPLTPFIVIYFASGLGVLFRRASAADPWRAGRIGLLIVVALHALDHAQYIAARRDPDKASRIDWLADAAGADDTLAWMRVNLTGPGAVASNNPALIYLRTGRKGVTFDGSTLMFDEWSALGIRYVVSVRPSDVPAGLAAHRVVYRDQTRRLWIVELSRSGGS